jgi:hypothetical protein
MPDPAPVTMAALEAATVSAAMDLTEESVHESSIARRHELTLELVILAEVPVRTLRWLDQAATSKPEKARLVQRFGRVSPVCGPGLST